MNIKNILLIGRTGSGKSTLANVLINKNNQFEEVFKESAGSVSQTKNIQVQEFLVNLREDGTEQVRYLVVDTAGFGDTQLTNKEILQLLEELVKYIGNDGVNQIFLVNSGRFTREEIDVYQILESVLFDREVANYTTIVRTRFPEFENESECEADQQSLRRENNELFNLVGSAKIIYVDNPPLVGRPTAIELNRETRKESNKRLITYLGTCQTTYKPNNLDNLKQRINNYKTKTEQLQKELQDKEKARQERESQLQQQINSLQTQFQNELNWASQNFNNQLNATYTNQQRQINEINTRHQREVNSLRVESNRLNEISEIQAGKKRAWDGGYTAGKKPNNDWDRFATEQERKLRDERYSSGSELFNIWHDGWYESYKGNPYNNPYNNSGDQNHAERLRQLRQQIQEQENRNQALISNLNQQISQSQQGINNQMWAEQNRINQRYQQTENNLRSEITRQNQDQANERQRIQQELNKLQSEYNQHIEQKMPSNFPWRR